MRVRLGGPEWETVIGEEAKEPTESRSAEVRRMGSFDQGCQEMPCTYQVTVAGAVSPPMAPSSEDRGSREGPPQRRSWRSVTGLSSKGSCGASRPMD
jgi:hypothetical protein